MKLFKNKAERPTIETLNTQIAILNSRLPEIDNRLIELEELIAEKNALARPITALLEECNSLEREALTIPRSIDLLNSTISDIVREEKAAALDAQRAKLEAVVKSLSPAIQKIQSSINAYLEAVESIDVDGIEGFRNANLKELLKRISVPNPLEYLTADVQEAIRNKEAVL